MSFNTFGRVFRFTTWGKAMGRRWALWSTGALRD